MLKPMLPFFVFFLPQDLLSCLGFCFCSFSLFGSLLLPFPFFRSLLLATVNNLAFSRLQMPRACSASRALSARLKWRRLISPRTAMRKRSKLARGTPNSSACVFRSSQEWQADASGQLPERQVRGASSTKP